MRLAFSFPPPCNYSNSSCSPKRFRESLTIITHGLLLLYVATGKFLHIPTIINTLQHACPRKTRSGKPAVQWIQLKDPFRVVSCVVVRHNPPTHLHTSRRRRSNLFKPAFSGDHTSFPYSISHTQSQGGKHFSKLSPLTVCRLINFTRTETF